MSKPLSNSEVIHIAEAATRRRAGEAAVVISKFYARGIGKKERAEMVRGITKIICRAMQVEGNE